MTFGSTIVLQNTRSGDAWISGNGRKFKLFVTAFLVATGHLNSHFNFIIAALVKSVAHCLDQE